MFIDMNDIYEYETDIRIKKKITNARRKAQKTIRDLEDGYLTIKPPLRSKSRWDSPIVYAPNMPNLTNTAE